jgi:N4-gp56 family major capsid protein
LADMNVTPARPGLTPIQWSSDFWVEYIRSNQFTPYFGTTMDAMIQLRTDLTREPGDSVVFPTVRSLVGAGVTGNAVLEGNEEILNARSLKVPVGVIRHAVAVSQWDEQKSVIDLLNAARQVLKNWAMNKLRADIILSLGAVTADGDVQISYAAATAAQRNTWLVNNSDRVLFGASKSNNTGVYATSLTNIDNTADKLTAAQITLAKRIARTASPKIRPIRVNDDEEWYVMFVPSMVFRDLMLDPTIVNSLQYAWNRGSDNPLFTAGDILYDGVIVREIPELPTIPDVGAGATVDAGASYLCGAQAIGIAWAQRTKAITNERDYGFFSGVGVQEIRGVAKLRFGTDPTVDQTKPVDNGVVTVWSAAEPDA